MWMVWNGFAMLVPAVWPWKHPRMTLFWPLMPDFLMKGEFPEYMALPGSDTSIEISMVLSLYIMGRWFSSKWFGKFYFGACKSSMNFLYQLAKGELSFKHHSSSSLNASWFRLQSASHYLSALLCSYACSWRRQNPCTDGLSGETKDLWVFYFTDLPDIADTLAKGLTSEFVGRHKLRLVQENFLVYTKGLNLLY